MNEEDINLKLLHGLGIPLPSGIMLNNTASSASITFEGIMDAMKMLPPVERLTFIEHDGTVYGVKEQDVFPKINVPFLDSTPPSSPSPFFRMYNDIPAVIMPRSSMFTFTDSTVTYPTSPPVDLPTTDASRAKVAHRSGRMQRKVEI